MTTTIFKILERAADELVEPLEPEDARSIAFEGLLRIAAKCLICGGKYDPEAAADCQKQCPLRVIGPDIIGNNMDEFISNASKIQKEFQEAMHDEDICKFQRARFSLIRS